MSFEITLPDNPSELREEIMKLLGEPYQYARALLIHSESITLRRNWVAMYNLRDAFDHLRNVLFAIHQGNTDMVIARRETLEVYDHIRRAIVESAQDTTEYLLYMLDEKLVNPHFLYKLAWIKVPSQIEINEAILSAKTKMEAGRQEKNKFYEWKNVVINYKEAEDIIIELDKKLPTRQEAYFRIASILSILLAAYGIYITK